MTEHVQLRVALDQIHYPEGMISCSKALEIAGITSAHDGHSVIHGQSFFPGGKGHQRDGLPTGGVMYLGNYFDKAKGFIDSVQRGREENLTWRCIRTAVFPHIPEENVWFTNYFMGVSIGNTNIGAIERTEGFQAYEEDCWRFLNLQVSVQRPSVIAALGRNVVQPLGAQNRLNIPSWHIDSGDSYQALRFKVHEVSFCHGGERIPTKIVAVYHPSYGRGAQKLREIGRDAEFIALQACNSSLKMEDSQ